jgi:hypothetical protein
MIVRRGGIQGCSPVCEARDTLRLMAAFDNFKVEFAKAAGSEPDQKVQIKVILTDYSK